MKSIHVVFSRPTKSQFTRVQRLSCAICLLFCTMLTSAMFYGSEEENSDQQGLLEIGEVIVDIWLLLNLFKIVLCTAYILDAVQFW